MKEKLKSILRTVWSWRRWPYLLWLRRRVKTAGFSLLRATATADCCCTISGCSLPCPRSTWRSTGLKSVHASGRISLLTPSPWTRRSGATDVHTRRGGHRGHALQKAARNFSPPGSAVCSASTPAARRDMRSCSWRTKRAFPKTAAGGVSRRAVPEDLLYKRSGQDREGVRVHPRPEKERLPRLVAHRGSAGRARV